MVTFDYLLKRGKDVLEEEEITLDEAIRVVGNGLLSVSNGSVGK